MNPILALISFDRRLIIFPNSVNSPESASKIVDNIVAAALAFAEKAHDTDSHGLKVRSSGTTNTSRMLSQRSKPDAALRASAVTQGSSIHSFFSGVLVLDERRFLPGRL